ncbi:radical SAM family heme chaperone HemW [Breoghania sp. L-A4]|uniref:radical SAM family heme chaperone HemW n=1 Tax=Breoghania sp. L-A4 TaxID=2304600 RepID=UPI000E35B5FC|nr:radical SAM family heme chaperone HemW [Breoghania sp. L-A4]AXS41687.1 radical SAM family heme chaperone HemW [Breoghania sp. L-A4]
MSDASEKYIRRNIHTYPFKYTYSEFNDFFKMQDASIYIHIPFCSTKCHFCDYTVYVNTKLDLREQYVQALCVEIERFPDNPVFPRFEIKAIYFGGGTPGLLSSEQLIRILEAVRGTFDVAADAEIAIEFDPRSVEQEKVDALFDAGFNRFSIGIQSFDEKILKDTNRPHGREDIDKAVDIIRNSGFTHVNVDLIYPLIGLTSEIWEDSVRRAIDLEFSCITAYPLEVWTNTAYHKWIVARGMKLPKIAEEKAMALTAFNLLEAAGYVTGSTSGYYHPDRCRIYCRFLDYYWRTWPMIGFGVSSKSAIQEFMYTNITDIKDYIARINRGEPVLDFSTYLSKDQEMRRVMIRGLKVGNVYKDDFQARFGVPMKLVYGEIIDELAAEDYLVDGEYDVHLTRKGQLYSNAVWERFYTEDDLRPPREGEVNFGLSELILD